MNLKCITKVFISVVCVGDPAVASHLRHLCLSNDPVPAHKTLCKSVCGLTASGLDDGTVWLRTCVLK